MDKRLAGIMGERLIAKQYLSNKYELLALNYRCRYGEIDIIARKADTIVFCEVKTRKNSTFAQAKEAVTYSKQQKIKTTAALYLSSEKLENLQVRFDVAEVYYENKDNICFNILQAAFE